MPINTSPWEIRKWVRKKENEAKLWQNFPMPFLFKIRTSTKPQNEILEFQSLVLQPISPNLTKKTHKFWMESLAPNLRVMAEFFKEARGSQFLVQPWCKQLGFDAWKAKERWRIPWCKTAPSPVLWSQEPNPKSMVKTYPKPTGFGGKFYALILSILCLNS